jgi:hypothetical protein
MWCPENETFCPLVKVLSIVSSLHASAGKTGQSTGPVSQRAAFVCQVYSSLGFELGSDSLQCPHAPPGEIVMCHGSEEGRKNEAKGGGHSSWFWGTQ